MKLKIIEYNILTGFYATDKKPFEHQKWREEAAVKFIKRENPDVLILIEACFLRDDNPYKIKQDYKKIFNYQYEAKTEDIIWEGVDWEIVILSKYPLKSQDLTIKNFRFLRINLEIGNKNIQIDGLHPAPTAFSEYARMQIIRNVLRDMKKPYILAGDLNAFSPQDKYDKKKLIKGFEKYFSPEEKKKAKSLVEDILKRKTIKYILGKKLTDTYKKIHKKFDYTYHPQKFGCENKDDLSRLDYIFCSNDFKVIDAGIIKNEFSERASDHYPIYAVLELKTK